MKNIKPRSILAILMIFISSCNGPVKKHIQKPAPQKLDNAIFWMYKIYAGYHTTIVDFHNGERDTLVERINYLCLPVTTLVTEMPGDTTTISVFFEPENGTELEDKNCEFAYVIGFIGMDSEPDFIEFGDNYYELTTAEFLKRHNNLDTIFWETVRREECISAQLRSLIDKFYPEHSGDLHVNQLKH
jgi:hypothetical protein